MRDGIEFVYSDPDEQALFELFSRGAEAYESPRFVVTRSRVIPVGYAQPAEVSATELIYTTGQLIATFGVPQGFRQKLPITGPTTPSNTMWGWRVRANDSQFHPSVNKVEERMEWAFAAWSTLLYTPA